MATAKGQSAGKSMFLKEYFVDHPDARKEEIDQAWRDAGNEGTISASLVKQVRSGLGLTGKGRARKGSGARRQSSAAPQPDVRRTGPRAGGRRANEGHVEGGAEPAATSRRAGAVQTAVLISLEARIDDLLHEARVAGGLPEFEEALRKARRSLARSHGG